MAPTPLETWIELVNFDHSGQHEGEPREGDTSACLLVTQLVVLVTQLVLRICTILLAIATLVLMGENVYVTTVDGENVQLYLFIISVFFVLAECCVILLDHIGRTREDDDCIFLCFVVEQLFAYLMTSATTAQLDFLANDSYESEGKLKKLSVCHHDGSSLGKSGDKYCYHERAAYATAVCCTVGLACLALFPAPRLRQRPSARPGW